jgi:hypothetical protein
LLVDRDEFGYDINLLSSKVVRGGLTPSGPTHIAPMWVDNMAATESPGSVRIFNLGQSGEKLLTLLFQIVIGRGALKHQVKSALPSSEVTRIVIY